MWPILLSLTQTSQWQADPGTEDWGTIFLFLPFIHFSSFFLPLPFPPSPLFYVLLDRWIVSAVSPIVDQVPRYLDWFHLRRETWTTIMQNYYTKTTATIINNRLIVVVEAVSTRSKQRQCSVEWKRLVPSCKWSVVVEEYAGTIYVELIRADVGNRRKIVIEKARLQHKVFRRVQFLENPTAAANEHT